jgi:hypothetical protein
MTVVPRVIVDVVNFVAVNAGVFRLAWPFKRVCRILQPFRLHTPSTVFAYQQYFGLLINCLSVSIPINNWE